MLSVVHGVAFNICWDNYYSRTYVRIRRMVLVSLYGVSDLSDIMSNYSDGVWFQERMQLLTLIAMIVLMI